MEETNNTTPPHETKRFGCLQVFGIILASVLITALLTFWWVRHNIYASPFSPTKLSVKEQTILDAKIRRLEESPSIAPQQKHTSDGENLSPEAYSEEGVNREISLTEKELNGLIANDPEIAQRVALDLDDDLISVKLVMPMDQDLPLFGGKTLRLKMGLTLAYKENRPVVALRGVTLGGVPLPNAWLGDLKHKNMVEEFGTEEGFWKLFAAGVDHIQVQEGHILVRLKE